MEKKKPSKSRQVGLNQGENKSSSDKPKPSVPRFRVPKPPSPKK